MTKQERIEKLAKGETIQYRESGNSMTGIIESRQLITCEPIPDYSKVKTGDAVFCKVKGNYYSHLVQGIKSSFKDGVRVFEFLIGNNRGGTNGWTGQHKVYGKVTKVED